YLQKNSEVIKPIRLIGQSKRQNDKGFSQKKQWEAVSSFKSGFRNVLIATQVGEEGLDITSTDAVVFFDNTSSAIRFIQRKGRTGRIKTGKVYILYFRNTRDESYLWAAMRKEKKLKKFLREISSAGGSSIYPSLLEFTNLHKKEFSSEVKIIIDYRELKSQVASELKKLGVALIPTNLSIGDYIISEKVCIERKTAGDFSKSIVDNRLFDQIRALKSAYESPILLIEGESLYLTGVDAKAVRGALITIAVDYGLPILWSRSAIETALLLRRMAIREQREKGVRMRIRAEKKPPTLYEQQLYLVSGLPGIERKLAERLLRKFSTPQKVFTASQQELVEVEGIGKQKANQIRKTLTTPFKPESNSN
ncbi:DEAD/DEAH box helicase, partial [archaeon]